jgi:hypothetical protein
MAEIDYPNLTDRDIYADLENQDPCEYHTHQKNESCYRTQRGVQKEENKKPEITSMEKSSPPTTIVEAATTKEALRSISSTAPDYITISLEGRISRIRYSATEFFRNFNAFSEKVNLTFQGTMPILAIFGTVTKYYIRGHFCAIRIVNDEGETTHKYNHPTFSENGNLEDIYKRPAPVWKSPS